MINNIITIIPARGGSKGVPKKNIREIGGKPLIAHTLELAKQCKLLNKIIVSTDCDEIASVAVQYGVEVIKRPDALSQDQSRTEEALLHVIETLEKNNEYYTDVVTLEVTSPLRTLATIEKALSLYNDADADSLVTLVEDRSYLWKFNGTNYQSAFDNQPRRRQEREPLFKEAGVIYITKIDILKKKCSVIGDKIIHLKVDDKEAIDINTFTDFKIAESYLAENQ